LGEKWASLTHPVPWDDADADADADAAPAMPSKITGTASRMAANLVKREIIIGPPTLICLITACSALQEG
jgi:hypothetical protein